MQLHCKQCQVPYTFTDEDRAFLDDVAPVIAGKGITIPPPTLCPDCRQQRRLTWRNERTMYSRTCSATGKKFISPLSPDKPFPVYENDEWYNDHWDAMQYGRPFDFSRPFFSQFQELLYVVPQLGRSCASLQNCDYVNQCGWSKDCYLIFEADYDEGCFYSNNLWQSKNSMDMLQCFGCELCYACIDCRGCYNLRFSVRSENCADSWFLQGCIGCRDCIGCVNLRNKRHCIFNEQYTPEEYAQRRAAFALHMRSGIDRVRRQFETFRTPFPVKCLQGTHNEASLGDGLWRTQRCHSCYDITNCQDCRYLYQSRNMKKVGDVMNFGAEGSTEFCYECHEIGDSVRNVLFSDQVWTGCHDILYCKLCVNSSHHCFGCVGLKHASYCIFNVQYTPEEYETIVTKIIAHMQKTREWGEFAPGQISPYGYNETLAQQYYPLVRSDALAQGYRWKDDVEQLVVAVKVILGEQLPEDIASVPDDILEWAVQCTATGRPFKIVRQELDWYRRQNLPAPQIHPDERHWRRMRLRNPRKLWSRKCGDCGKGIETTFSPEQPEIVYCEECYLKAVY